MSVRRRLSWHLLPCLAVALAVAGCGGGGGSSAAPPVGPTPAPTATPFPGSSQANIGVSPAGPGTGSFGPVTGGYTGTVTVPAASASATLTVTFLAVQPGGTPTVQNLLRRPQNIGAQNISPLGFVTVTTTQTVTFPKTPDFTFTAPFNVAQLAPFAYVAEYDPSKASSNWVTIEGPASASGNTLTFTGAPPPITLSAGLTYSFLIFSVPSAIPTPAPTATPVPTASPTPLPGLVAIGAPFPASPGGGHGGLNCPANQPSGCMSVYAISSYPSGNAWKRIKLDGTSTVVTQSTAPANDTPATAPYQYQYQFTPQNQLGAGTFNVTVDQVRDGAHQVYYNATGDSRGSVDTSQLQSVRRSGTLGVARTATAPADTVRRRFQAFKGPDIDPAHVYVRYHAAVLKSSGRNAVDIERAEGVSGVQLASLSENPLRAVNVPAGVSATTFAQRLRGHSEVADVSAVHMRHPLTRPALTPTNADPHYKLPDQWYLYAGGFPNAWSYNTGGNATIAIIDTGIDMNNTDLTSKLVFKEKIVGLNPTSSPQDTNGHGTNTAGIAAAATNNTLGFAGAGFNVRLMAFNIFADGTAPGYSISASTADEALAIAHAIQNGASVISLSIGAGYNVRLIAINIFADGTAPGYSISASTADEALAIAHAIQNGASVISLSLGAGQGAAGSDGYDQGEYDAIQAALSAGVTVVAAAGNNADGGEASPANTNLDYPAAYPGVIAVGATGLTNTTQGDYSTASEHVTSYSQYGPSLSVVAPGGDPTSGNDTDDLHWIRNYMTSTSVDPGFQCKTPSPATSCEARYAGTSQATPQVAAAAALLISASGGKGVLSPGQIAQIIQNTADNINDPHQGHGRLNAYRAIASLIGDTAAYSGPVPIAHGTAQLIAFAYKNSGANRPVILDYDYPAGVPVGSDGFFRIGDVLDTTGSYRVAVWYDGNGDGKIDAGDWIGVSPTTCSSTSLCAIGTISLAPVSGTYALP